MTETVAAETGAVETTESRNKAIVREAFDTLFNKRDYAAAEKFWAPEYIQHSAHIPPGRDGLFNLVKSLPSTLSHELELIMAAGDLLLVRGRFAGNGRPAAWIAVDLVRMEDGLLKEHWDVLQDEVSREESVSKLPMFGDTWPEDR
jgi:predicted SnoaL-like aldol condensation-catalyzing enzyme